MSTTALADEAKTAYGAPATAPDAAPAKQPSGKTAAKASKQRLRGVVVD